MATQEIKIILFDLGGVLIKLFPQRTVAAFAALGEQTEDAVLAAYEGASIFQQYEKGLISNYSFRIGVQELLGFKTSDSAFDEAWNAMLGDIPSHIPAVINQLKTSYNCAVLSNTNAIHEAAFHQILSKQHQLNHLNELFDHVYFSHELQERKPDAVIYEKVAAALAVQAQEILFLDDSEVNIAAAQSVGMQGLHIPRNGGFHELLTSYLSA